MFWKTRKELKKELDFWKKKATIDSLTKTYNRIELEQTDISNFSWITFIDINNLGKVNKEKGFYVGDSLIIEVVELLRLQLSLQYMSENSKIFRIGGDEFIILSEHPTNFRKHSLYKHSQIRIINCPIDKAIQEASKELINNIR